MGHYSVLLGVRTEVDHYNVLLRVRTEVGHHNVLLGTRTEVVITMFSWGREQQWIIIMLFFWVENRSGSLKCCSLGARICFYYFFYYEVVLLGTRIEGNHYNAVLLRVRTKVFIIMLFSWEQEQK